MKDNEKHTPPRHTGQLSHAEILSAVKRIIAEKFTARDITELQSWLRGVAAVAQRKGEG